jgi:hypothetical protein
LEIDESATTNVVSGISWKILKEGNLWIRKITDSIVFMPGLEKETVVSNGGRVLSHGNNSGK